MKNEFFIYQNDGATKIECLFSLPLILDTKNAVALINQSKINLIGAMYTLPVM